jgi:hypothetical protein
MADYQGLHGNQDVVAFHQDLDIHRLSDTHAAYRRIEQDPLFTFLQAILELFLVVELQQGPLATHARLPIRFRLYDAANCVTK